MVAIGLRPPSPVSSQTTTLASCALVAERGKGGYWRSGQVKALEKIARKVSGRPKLTLDDQKDLLVLFRWLLYPIFKVTRAWYRNLFAKGSLLSLDGRLCGCFPDGSGLGPQPGDFVLGNLLGDEEALETVKFPMT